MNQIMVRFYSRCYFKIVIVFITTVALSHIMQNLAVVRKFADAVACRPSRFFRQPIAVVFFAPSSLIYCTAPGIVGWF